MDQTKFTEDIINHIECIPTWKHLNAWLFEIDMKSYAMRKFFEKFPDTEQCHGRRELLERKRLLFLFGNINQIHVQCIIKSGIISSMFFAKLNKKCCQPLITRRRAPRRGGRVRVGSRRPRLYCHSARFGAGQSNKERLESRSWCGSAPPRWHSGSRDE